ncbi:unnamed protein product [Closterium sp. NIES-65]|nr:unnamed protein product [Closterium sp. NIES-65]
MGPALAIADVTTEDGDVTRWRVTYRVWDAGDYSPILHVLTPDKPICPSFVLLPFLLTIPKSTNSQCDHAIHGRWLFNAQKRAYKWQFYPCAHPLPPTSQWLSALQSRGISEINFVGDSHVRFLCHHLFFLLTGKANASAVKLHEYHQLVVPPPSPELQPLTLNFYWIGGIYIDGPFGCSYKNVTSFEQLTFPNISTTASVTLVDGGFWMTVFCAEPENALGYYLPNYLQWVYSQKELAMQAQRQPQQQQQQQKKLQGNQALTLPARAGPRAIG